MGSTGDDGGPRTAGAAAGPETIGWDAHAASPQTAPTRLDAAQAQAPAGGTDAASPGPTAVRTTVLPRIQWAGERPELTTDRRQRFDFERTLGVGGAGEVWVARDLDIGRRVAVKKIRAEARSSAALLRFVDEIRTVGRLEHPNVIPIHDVGVDEHGDYYFVMKLIEGDTLQAIIERLAAGDRETHARYGFERRVQIFRGLLEAVAFAHAQGFVHRDIKPANVMVGPFGEVVLMDWGIAKPLAGPSAADAAAADAAAGPDDAPERLFETQVGSLMGTPAYMCPEQANSAAVDARSDVYSLSVLFHELLYLRHYLAAKQSLPDMLIGVLEEDPRFLRDNSHPHQPPVPMDLGWYCRKGMQKDPAKRYQSVEEMLARLDRRADGDIPIECHITFVKRVTGKGLKFADRHPMAATMGLVAVAAGGIGGLIAALA